MTHRVPPLFRYWLLCLLIIPVGACVDAFAIDDIDSWNPPPKKYTVLPLFYRAGMPPKGLDMPNLCNEYFFHLSYGKRAVNLRPMSSWTPAGKEMLERVLAVPEERKRTFEFPAIAAMDGYGANYLDLKRGDIIPLLGHLFYAVDGRELHRLEPTHPAYKKLGFPVEGTFSFPYPGDVVQKWYDHVSEAKERGLVPSERYPNYAYDIFRGNKLVLRNIRTRSVDAKRRLEVELAISPYVWRGRAYRPWPKQRDFHWYSVGDELAVPWAFGLSSDDDDLHMTTDLKYYKITNIVPPDSPTIKVQPEDGGAPIECKPIGWVDIDIHGRKEPAGKKE